VYPQAYLYRGSFGLLAEYTDNRHTVRRDTEVGEFHHRGWQVAASVFLTGERASYRSVTPKKVFDLQAGTFGAVELAARLQSAGVDEDAFPVFADPAVSARRARAWGVGVNWHLAKNLKVMLDLERATFTGGAGTGDRPAETFVATRFQFAY
jgi:phosphate-selective porin OprO/OprP